MATYEPPTWTNNAEPPINATNLQQISDNIAATQADLETLTTAVGENTTDIAQNTLDITQNASDIDQNTSDISQNTSDIATLQSTVGAQGGAITTINTTLDRSILTLSNAVVTTGAFASDSTYPGYGYKATVSFAGVTTSHVVSVIFAPTEADSLNYATICGAGTNFVYIWAKEVPASSITIPSIIAAKQTTISA